MYAETYQKFMECAARKCGLGKEAGGPIVAAVSGGADSVCMLLLLQAYFGKERLICAHFNHKIRGADAERDARFTEALANSLGIRFRYGEEDVPRYAGEQALGLEEAARTVRYAFLRDTAAQAGTHALIATAHNRSDQIETILHNIARGTSVDGLKGIEYRKNDIVRPVLDLSRNETEEVCAQFGIRPVYDVTNADNRYTRNKIRNEVLPYLKSVFGSGFEERLLHLSQSAAADSDYLNQAAWEAFRICCRQVAEPFDKITLERAQYVRLHEALQKRLVRCILSKIRTRAGNLVFPDFSGIYSAMIERVCALAESSVPGKILELPSGVRCVTEYGGLSFTHQSWLEHGVRQTGVCDDFTIEERIVSNGEALRLAETISGDAEVFDADTLRETYGADYRIEFRENRAGDHFTPFGSSGGKSLRKFFIDRKIGRLERDFIVVAAIGSEVLWIPGIRRSAIAPIDKNSSRVIIVKHVGQTEVYG